MAKDKTTLPSNNVLTAIGAKTITGAAVFRHGVVTVIQLSFSDSTTTYIKVTSNNGVEIGGTAEMGTGTKVA